MLYDHMDQIMFDNIWMIYLAYEFTLFFYILSMHYIIF